MYVLEQMQLLPHHPSANPLFRDTLEFIRLDVLDELCLILSHARFTRIVCIGILSEEKDQNLDICSRIGIPTADSHDLLWPHPVIQHALALNVRILANSGEDILHYYHLKCTSWFTIQSSHFAWLSTYLEALHRQIDSGKMEREEAWDLTADAFLLLSCTPGTWDNFVQDSDTCTLLRTLKWVLDALSTRLSADPGTVEEFHQPSYRLQCATIHLVHSLFFGPSPSSPSSIDSFSIATVESPQVKERHRLLLKYIPDFPMMLSTFTVTDPFDLVATAALADVSRDPAVEVLKRHPGVARDKAVVEIICTLANSDGWLDSPENDTYVLIWIRIIHHGMRRVNVDGSRKLEHTALRDNVRRAIPSHFSAHILVRGCERLRRLPMETWNALLGESAEPVDIRRVAVVAVYADLLASCNWQDDSEVANSLERTLEVLRLGVDNDPLTQWYIEDMMDIVKNPFFFWREEGLPVQHALQALVDRYRSY